MTTIQVRDVPASVHKKAQVRAKALKTSLSGYVRGLIERDVQRVPLEETLARAHQAFPRGTQLNFDIADVMSETRPAGSAK
jgi:plasmid stability protein